MKIQSLALTRETDLLKAKNDFDIYISHLSDLDRRIKIREVLIDIDRRIGHEDNYYLRALYNYVNTFDV